MLSIMRLVPNHNFTHKVSLMYIASSLFCLQLDCRLYNLFFAGDTVYLSLPVGTFTASMLDLADQVILVAAGSG